MTTKGAQIESGHRRGRLTPLAKRRLLPLLVGPLRHAPDLIGPRAPILRPLERRGLRPNVLALCNVALRRQRRKLAKAVRALHAVVDLLLDQADVQAAHLEAAAIRLAGGGRAADRERLALPLAPLRLSGRRLLDWIRLREVAALDGRLHQRRVVGVLPALRAHVKRLALLAAHARLGAGLHVALERKVAAAHAAGGLLDWAADRLLLVELGPLLFRRLGLRVLGGVGLVVRVAVVFVGLGRRTLLLLALE